MQFQDSTAGRSPLLLGLSVISFDAAAEYRGGPIRECVPVLMLDQLRAGLTSPPLSLSEVGNVGEAWGDDGLAAKHADGVWVGAEVANVFPATEGYSGTHDAADFYTLRVLDTTADVTGIS